MTSVFHFGRTWMNFLLKLKRWKGDIVYLIQLVCLESMGYQLHHCTLESTMQHPQRTPNLENLHILGNFTHQLIILIRMPMEAEGHTCQVFIPRLTNEVAECGCVVCPRPSSLTQTYLFIWLQYTTSGSWNSDSRSCSAGNYCISFLNHNGL